MGCVSSQEEFELNDVFPTVFQVSNVDEEGNQLYPGQLEVTEYDIVLYQRGRPPVIWPLKALRRYGFDSEHFSFESGRRCPTGPGIYAFRCRRAEQLFSLLQKRIHDRNSMEPPEPSGNPPGRVGYLKRVSVVRVTPVNQVVPDVKDKPDGPTKGTVILATSSTHSSASQSDSVDSATFNSVLPFIHPESQNLYANEEAIAAALQKIEPKNNLGAGKPPPPPPLLSRNYINTTIPESLVPKHTKNYRKYVPLPPPENSNHLYMNIDPATGEVLPFIPPARPGSREHAGFIQSHPNYVTEKGLIYKRSLPPPPPPKKLNYIVLDLEPSIDVTKSPNCSSPPVTPLQSSPGYAAIDFKKTVALSNSANPNFDHDSEGSRRTRHNSNIDDLTPHARPSTSGSD